MVVLDVGVIVLVVVVVAGGVVVISVVGWLTSQ